MNGKQGDQIQKSLKKMEMDSSLFNPSHRSMDPVRK